MKWRKALVTIASLMLVLFHLAGCAPKQQAQPAKGKISITDTRGRVVEVPCPPQRIVVCNSYVAEVLCVLEASDRVVGAPKDMLSFPILDQKLKHTSDVGAMFTPNAEQVLALKPDLVFAWSTTKEEIVDQLQKAGVPVVLLDCSRFDKLAREIEIVGKIMAREERAAELVAFINKYHREIEKRTKDLPEKDRPSVYWESMSDYSTCTPGSSDWQILEVAGGKSIFEDKNSQSKVSPEWVVTKNPQVIIKCPGTGKIPSGYGVSDAALKKQREDILSRTELKDTEAIKSGKVFVLSRRAASGPQTVIGLVYVAKWLHPQLFLDMDPEAIQRELIERYYHMSYAGGTWGYPEPR